MTPNGALTAVIARLTAAGLVQARSPLGVSNASSQRISRSFSVLPLSIGPSGSPGRGRADVPGLRVSQVFRVTLGHQIKPGDGQEGPSQALQDYHRAAQFINANGSTIFSQGAALIFGQASHRYVSGGAFMLTEFTITLTYEMSLVVPS